MINTGYNVQFKSIPINKTHVRKLNHNLQKFVDTEANFVLLEPTNRFDLKAVRECEKSWDNSFAKIISTNFQWSSVNKRTNNRTYALTLQKNNFYKLDSNSILGLANITKNGREMFLEYLQVKPEAMNINQEGDKLFNGCGTAIIKSFQNLFNKIALNSTDKNAVRQFYLHNGFIRSIFDENFYIWKNNISFKIWRLIVSCLNTHSVD